MIVFLLSFLAFVLAVALMAVGVVVAGKRLHGSCGGVVGPDGEEIGDCLCARKQVGICASAEGNELVQLAELGYPQRKDHFGVLARRQPPGPPPLSV
ncbi:MAG: hypothetical protein D6702_04800 [Planctomycetota bacterium]|nr:MAG: hypothetical protein D6702_04800 [Planctomycetota bacterium]